MQEIQVHIKKLEQAISVTRGMPLKVKIFKKAPKIVVAPMIGYLFDTNKNFMLPGNVRAMTELWEFCEKFPVTNVVVVGHTDRKGEQWYNNILSEERAEAVATYLRDEIPYWESRFKTSNGEKKKWGDLELQYMLAILPRDALPFYRGIFDGNHERTRNAVARFQQWSNEKRDTSLPTDGNTDAATRKEIITCYMEIDNTTLDGAIKLDKLGLGEKYPLIETEDDVSMQLNRRVEIFMFTDPDAVGPINAESYERWKKEAEEIFELHLGLEELIPTKTPLPEIVAVGWGSNEGQPGSEVELIAIVKYPDTGMRLSLEIIHEGSETLVLYRTDIMLSEETEYRVPWEVPEVFPDPEHFKLRLRGYILDDEAGMCYSITTTDIPGHPGITLNREFQVVKDITFELVNDNGTPIVNQTVFLHSSDPEAEPVEMVTGTDGTIILSQLIFSQYRISIPDVQALRFEVEPVVAPSPDVEHVQFRFVSVAPELPDIGGTP